jgi:hypothetical protein
MARASARNVRPSLSDDPRDKLAAALGWHYGRFKESREYQMAPIYFDDQASRNADSVRGRRGANRARHGSGLGE